MDQSKDLVIRKFPIKLMKQNPTILIFGPRRTGKSVLLRHLIYEMNQKKPFNAGFMMGGSRDAREDVKDIFPDSFNLEFDLGKFKEMIEKIKKFEDPIKNNDISILTCYDDCTYDKQFLKSKEARDISMNGRHLNCTDIKCMQYVMDMPPDTRTQMDYVFVTRQSRLDIMQKMWKFFFGIFPKFDEFRQVLKQCTDNYEVLVLDNTSTSNNISDNIFYFKADINLPKFKLFDPVYWVLDKYYRDLTERRKNKQAQQSAGLIVNDESNTALQITNGSSSDTKQNMLDKFQNRIKPNAVLDNVNLFVQPISTTDEDKEINKNLQESVTKKISLQK